jgi:hypothetical protein
MPQDYFKSELQDHQNGSRWPSASRAAKAIAIAEPEWAQNLLKFQGTVHFRGCDEYLTLEIVL